MNQLVSKCARKLVPRWVLLAFIVHALILAIVSFATGNVPINMIMDQPNSPINMPFALSRTYDPLLAVIPFAVIAWLFADHDRLRERFTYIRLDGGLNPWGTVWGWGFFGGVSGSLIIGMAGFGWLLICTVICSLLVVTAAKLMVSENRQPMPLKESFLVEAIASLWIWWILTMFQGAAAGFIYALSVLVVSAVVHFGVFALSKTLAWSFTGVQSPFRRYMLTCDVDSENC